MNAESVQVRSTTAIIVPPDETVVINGLCRATCPLSTLVMFESGNTCLPGNVFVVPEVLDYGSTGRVKMHVQNFSTHSVQIP